MLTERYLWLGATTMTVGILLLLMLQPPERRDRETIYLGTDLGVIVSIDGGQTWRATLR
jgi:hypothetical protein